MVPIAAWEEFARVAGLAGLTREEAVARCGSEPLPPGLEPALTAAARRLGGPLAVRSSALAEDGHEASAAGIFAPGSACRLAR